MKGGRLAKHSSTEHQPVCKRKGVGRRRRKEEKRVIKATFYEGLCFNIGSVLSHYLFQANKKQEDVELSGMKKILKIITFGLSGAKLYNSRSVLSIFCSQVILRVLAAVLSCLPFCQSSSAWLCCHSPCSSVSR